MKTFSRFLSVLSLLALMSAPVLRAQDDQSYDPQTDDQAVQPAPQYDQQAPPQYDQQQPAPDYDQQANPPAQANPQYDAENSAPANTPDPPARAARLQYESGSVSVQPQGTGDWVTGELNRPLTNSDNIWADKNSRAEISVGTGLIRIDSESSLTLTSIAENAVQLQLHQGAMYLHVRRLYDGETYEVDTPNQAFTVQKPGDYRFDVDSDSDKTVITVWRGEGESTGSGPSVRIRSNQQARFMNGTSMTNDIHGAPAPDAFDEWAQSRDGRMDHSASARYVSPDVVGYEDLDEYGSWKETPDYGALWVPSVAPGWSPYYNGNWIWESPWGWTWVEAEPWGYAPFHYGRWVYGGGYWGWAPGPIWERPYYAPALVAWFGGPGWGVNFGFGFGGGFGWCPLGFGEPFIPWYGASRGYFNRVNITNTRITNITNINNIYNNNFTKGRPRPGSGIYSGRNGNQIHYANLHSPNGFTAASRNTLVNSLSVSRNSVRVSPNQLSRTSLAAVRSPEVRPTRTTMLGGNAGHPAAAPSRNFARPVVSHMTPPATNRNGMAALRNTPSMGRGNTGSPQMGGNRGISNPGNGARNSINGAPMSQRGPGSTMRSPNAAGTRSVPRPPSAGGMTGRSSMGSRPGMGAVNGPGSNIRPTGPQSARAMSPSERPQSVPRPQSGGMSRDGGPLSAPRGAAPGNSHGSAPASRSNGPRSEMSVPRPANSTSPSGFSSANRGSFSGAGNARSMSSRPGPSYQANNRPAPNYGGSNSRPTPSYGGGSYSRPAPSYNRGSSMPSYGRSMPSYGGGSYGRSTPSYGGGRSAAPSYSGGGRAPSYSAGRSSGGFGGGSRSSGGYGGGGGHASGGGGRASGGGGGHASSGGGGGHNSGGGSHGGRH